MIFLILSNVFVKKKIYFDQKTVKNKKIHSKCFCLFRFFYKIIIFVFYSLPHQFLDSFQNTNFLDYGIGHFLIFTLICTCYFYLINLIKLLKEMLCLKSEIISLLICLSQITSILNFFFLNKSRCFLILRGITI